MENKGLFEESDIVYYLKQELPNYYMIYDKKFEDGSYLYLIKEINHNEHRDKFWVLEIDLKLNTNIVSG